MFPEEIREVTTIAEHIIEGDFDELSTNPDGIVIGSGLVEKLSISLGDNITLAATTGQVRTVKIVGIFKTGRSNIDDSQTYVVLKRAQSLLNRQHRVNNIIVRLEDPYQSPKIAAEIEQRNGYKSVSWQEASEDIINTLAIRNIIMYTVVSAVLVVAAFGIYNVISTVVMEKYRDIAILKSMGFYSKDIRKIFLVQGLILGIAGCILGIPFGMVLMSILMQIEFRPPGSSEIITLPIDWSMPQFVVAGTFALAAALLAALLPARKAATVEPVEILRGGAW